jgi:hypothetical protein
MRWAATSFTPASLDLRCVSTSRPAWGVAGSPSTTGGRGRPYSYSLRDRPGTCPRPIRIRGTCGRRSWLVLPLCRPPVLTTSLRNSSQSWPRRVTWTLGAATARVSRRWPSGWWVPTAGRDGATCWCPTTAPTIGSMTGLTWPRRPISLSPPSPCLAPGPAAGR